MPVVLSRKIKRWLPPSLWACCILGASSIPGDNLPHQEIVGLDKMVHMGIYGVLGLLLARTGITYRKAWALAAIFGMVDELYQHFTPNRTPDPFDWLADATGAALGILLLRWLMQRKGSANP